MTSPLLADGVKTYNPGLGEYASGSYFDYAEDALGSVGGLMNSSQRQQEAYLNDAFGLPVSSNGTVSFAQGQLDGFAATSGYQTDNDTGLIRCGNRYYNPFLGRFITQDPAKSGANWYGYCANDPTDQTDASGLFPQSIDGININQVGFVNSYAPGSYYSVEYSERVGYHNVATANPGIGTSPAQEVNRYLHFVQMNGFNSNQEKKIQKSLNNIENTARGAELFYNAMEKSVMLSINSTSGPSEGGVDNGQVYLNFAQDATYSTQYGDVRGRVADLLIETIAHEIGHALGGAEDNGWFAGNNVWKNEDPIESGLGLPVRSGYFSPDFMRSILVIGGPLASLIWVPHDPVDTSTWIFPLMNY